ncbi:MAG: response regulator [Acidobacteriota bacterium]|nr:response regulator [Acidobacteriota bacterium]
MNESATAVVTILLVEDSDDGRHVLKLSLEANGYRVTEAHDGHEAVRVAREGCPDLILMDLNLPEMDGLAAAKLIRECREPCQDAPIVAVTAFDTYGMREAAAEAGCDAYLLKPLALDELEAVVAALLVD